MVDHANLLAQYVIQQPGVELGGQIDTFFTLPLTAAQVGNHQPGLFHQAVDLAEQRRPAIGQPILCTAGFALLGHAVGVGQRQQGAQPARVIGVGDRLRGLAAQVAAVLPGQLSGPLHATLPAPCNTALARQ